MTTTPKRFLPFKYRVGSKTKDQKYYICMPYVDARDVQDYLDQTYGNFGRQRKHEHKDWKVYCSIGIRDGNQWIRKEDVGDQTTIAKDKGASSDSFKRSAVNRGIGRFLYTMPTFHIPVSDCRWDITAIVKNNEPYRSKLKERFEKEKIKMEAIEDSKYQDDEEKTSSPDIEDQVNLDNWQ